jgi:hypothetical protein
MTTLEEFKKHTHIDGEFMLRYILEAMGILEDPYSFGRPSSILTAGVNEQGFVNMIIKEENRIITIYKPTRKPDTVG